MIKAYIKRIALSAIYGTNIVDRQLEMSTHIALQQDKIWQLVRENKKLEDKVDALIAHLKLKPVDVKAGVKMELIK